MIHSRLIPAGAGIIQPMIELARCSKLQRIIIAGSKGVELRSELHRRGFVRVATTASCGLPAGQYDVALVRCLPLPTATSAICGQAYEVDLVVRGRFFTATIWK